MSIFRLFRLLVERIVMIYSMTGFGRGDVDSDSIRYTVEIKAVNHRFLDINVKLPSYAFSLEEKIQKMIKEKIERGKIDVSVTIRAKGNSGKEFAFDQDCASVYLNARDFIKEQYDLTDDFGITSLLGLPGVISEKDMSSSPDSLWENVREALTKAIEKLTIAREKEGDNLSADLIKKADRLQELSHIIKERSPVIIDEYKSRLTKKVREFLEDKTIDDSRIASEVIIYADKICIDEELVRLSSHIKTFKDTIKSGGAVGRKLDFLTQELNREANTILSKSSDSYTADVGIEMKTLIEKLREQVQNLE